MENGSLQYLLKKEPHKLPLARKLTIARQIASGMRRIHEHGMIHRDIRPDNVLISQGYNAKISDMGIARAMDPDGKHTRIGCRQFMPPEFYTKYNQKLDIFTYGLTINQLFTELEHNFESTPTGPLISLKKLSPVFYHDIIKKCLHYEPAHRPTAIQIEKLLEFYEQAFMKTMLSDAFKRMDLEKKDEVFINFYQNNKSRIQEFVKACFPEEFKWWYINIECL